MRITPEQRQIIVQQVRRHFGPQARVLLFGSRTDDGARGGDIDLYIQPPRHEAGELLKTLQLGAALERALGEQKIDIVVAQPGQAARPIDQAALATGIEL